MTLDIENYIDKYELELDPITFFILPGGSTQSSLLHICRSITRRTETNLVKLSKREKVNQEIKVYFNRLSDLLFVLARVLNRRQGISDLAWEKN